MSNFSLTTCKRVIKNHKSGKPIVSYLTISHDPLELEAVQVLVLQYFKGWNVSKIVPTTPAQMKDWERRQKKQ